jgi:hydrogenase/urease accessory protein HupE
VTGTYFVQGIKHILTGYDHLLFLCALVLGATSLWNLIKIVTVFTLAHSITLTLAAYGLAHLPEQVVEPIIAVSIVFVAVQNVFWPKQVGNNMRLVVAFFFGLFHGFGFAGGLLELMHAMPANMIFSAIFGFSLGVEFGNQLVLLPLFGILQFLGTIQNKSIKPTLLSNFQRFGSGAVAIAGMCYLCVDLFSFY